MKKYLYGALALPLLFACSSDDLFEKGAVSNDQFAGIEKVDATFFMDEAAGGTRMATDWALENGDLYGFAWLTDGTVITADGRAYQNHPLTQTKLGTTNIFKPETSIYVGDYFLYRPYDYTVAAVAKINFKSLEEQTLTDGKGGQAWAGLANNAIIIGDKFTTVTAGGTYDASTGTTWDKAGIEDGRGNYKLYAAVFSNQSGLDLTYQKNNEVFDGKKIAGATDIDYTYPTGSTIGAADIYKIEATLTGAKQSFQYGPTTEPNAGAHNGNFWEDQKGLGTAFDFSTGAALVTLTAPEGSPISTDKADNKGWFWFNSLPNTAGTAVNTDNFTAKLYTSYGDVTVTKALKDCAYAYEDPTGTPIGQETPTAWNPEWIKLAAADAAPTTTTLREWDPAGHNTFINQYGNHKGKYALTVDFSTGVMNGMHIQNDTHLQKALKYYIASGKTETVILNLDGESATNKIFKMSKLSIALLQTINASGNKVTVQACASHNTPKIIVTQDGQAAIGLADKKEVPALNNVFEVATDVYLSSACEWTWKGGSNGKTALNVDSKVKSITNEGTLTVNATNIELYNVATLAKASTTLANANGATMYITKVTTVKNALTNLGEINVGSASDANAELRAYGIEIKNDATSLTAFGTINNYGAVGVTAGTGGTFNNYGEIDMMNNGAITLLSSNEKNGVAIVPPATVPANGPFSIPFAAATNMMGTVVLPEGNPTAIVSVANTDETGFIKYNWTAATYSHDTRNVKYNTLVVSDDIEFTWAPSYSQATEIQFIEFKDCNRAQVVNRTADGLLPNLRGIIVNAGSSIIIEKKNELVCSDGAFLGAGAAVYRGGIFTYVSTTNYLGTWSTDQILEY